MNMTREKKTDSESKKESKEKKKESVYVSK